jgi:hypothetical protein
MAKLALDANKRAVTLNSVGQPGVVGDAPSTQALRASCVTLGEEYNKLFTRFATENRKALDEVAHRKDLEEAALL